MSSPQGAAQSPADVRRQVLWADAHLFEAVAVGLEQVASESSAGPWNVGRLPGTIAAAPDERNEEQHVAYGMHPQNARAALAGDPRSLSLLANMLRELAAMRRDGIEMRDKYDLAFVHDLARRMGLTLPQPGEGPKPPPRTAPVPPRAIPLQTESNPDMTQVVRRSHDAAMRSGRKEVLPADQELAQSLSTHDEVEPLAAGSFMRDVASTPVTSNVDLDNGQAVNNEPNINRGTKQNQQDPVRTNSGGQEGQPPTFDATDFS